MSEELQFFLLIYVEYWQFNYDVRFFKGDLRQKNCRHKTCQCKISDIKKISLVQVVQGSSQSLIDLVNQLQNNSVGRVKILYLGPIDNRIRVSQKWSCIGCHWAPTLPLVFFLNHETLFSGALFEIKFRLHVA